VIARDALKLGIAGEFEGEAVFGPELVVMLGPAAADTKVF